MSTEILFDYEEILPRRLGGRRWEELMMLLEFVPGVHDNLLQVSPSFHWRLVTDDPDDDKFADCAFAAEAEWIITEDGHFSTLAASGHKPRAITPAEFIARFLTS
jgi:predicted nucleic acid-binding protein